MNVAIKALGALLIVIGHMGNWLFGIERGESGDAIWTRRSWVFDLSTGAGISLLIWGPD